VWGWVHAPAGTVAAYFAQWTLGHLVDHGANVDFILGAWGDGTEASDRSAVALVHCENSDGEREVMIVDAASRPVAESPLAGAALRRDQVIGTPLAGQIFRLVDAVCGQDERLFQDG
jgi:hypothetical protein